MVENRFKKILVPIDGSTSCLRARKLATLIARKFNSKITITHVVSHEFMHTKLKAIYQLPPWILHKTDEEYLKMGEKILSTAKEEFKKEGLQVESFLIRKSEDPANTILKLAEKQFFDLIVVGNRSATVADPFELGNTSEKIALYSKTPVLITKRETRIGKILVAVDGSEQANKCIKYALILARAFNARITLLLVLEKKLSDLEPESVRAVGEKILSDAACNSEGVDLETRLEYDHPAHTIIKVAREEDYDLIVLGSRGLSGIERYLLGSVSQYVSSYARRSVLIVR